MLKMLVLSLNLLITPIHHPEPMGENFVCFSFERMMADFLNSTTGWRKVLHETGEQADEFMLWFNSIPTKTRVRADEVIFFGKSDRNFYWIWFAHEGCWINLFKWSTSMGDIWIMKRERERGVKAND